VLGVDVSELGPLSLESTNLVSITNQCSIFAETEILHYMCEEKKIADIAAGINESMARRVKSVVM
jgi:activator of 2-hydroxyglutaryl-CoA dehydratase